MLYLIKLWVFAKYCYNRWTQSNTYVKRSIFMDDYVFSITEDTIKANKLDSLETDIAIIHLTDKNKCDNLHLDQCFTEKDCLSNNNKSKDIEFKLEEKEKATINLTARGCEVVYKAANTKEIKILCIKTTSNSNLYSAKFKLLDTDPFVMELISVK
ncbi:hypothetical protein [Candidatus Marithrix sp. Canyon 246]|nr:hypothetical protein [Candidatus Marithrix sp. Canyon 246]